LIPTDNAWPKIVFFCFCFASISTFHISPPGLFPAEVISDYGSYGPVEFNLGYAYRCGYMKAS
jgi:hypothetical protein